MTDRLRVTIVAEWKVRKKDLAYYEARTIEEAAANQQKWVDENEVDIGDIAGVAESVTCTVEAVSNAKSRKKKK
jgi:hypothetical protein